MLSDSYNSSNRYSFVLQLLGGILAVYERG